MCPSADFVDIPCSPGPGEEAGIPEVLIVTLLTFAFWQLFCMSISIFTVSQSVCIGRQVCEIQIIGEKCKEQGLYLLLIC